MEPEYCDNCGDEIGTKLGCPKCFEYLKHMALTSLYDLGTEQLIFQMFLGTLQGTDEEQAIRMHLENYEPKESYQDTYNELKRRVFRLMEWE